MVELPILGRRGTLAISTGRDYDISAWLFVTHELLVLTGVFILVSTTARTSDALLGWNCAYSFTSNVMYGVLYAVTPELFPTKDRGTGNAICSSANRVFGIMVRFIEVFVLRGLAHAPPCSRRLLLSTQTSPLLCPSSSQAQSLLRLDSLHCCCRLNRVAMLLSNLYTTCYV